MRSAEERRADRERVRVHKNVMENVRRLAYWSRLADTAAAHGYHDDEERALVYVKFYEGRLEVSHHCRRCGRPLWNVKSVENGMGPECASKAL